MIRTRIAPSPTGNDIHIGNLYTAMINYCFAKKHQGEFVIRIEDTDQTRLVKGAEAKILQSLDKYNIISQENPKKGGPYKPYRQSQRLELYQKYAKQLVESGHAYYCTCSKERLDKLRKQAQAQKQIPKYDKYCLSRQQEIRKQINNGQPYVIRLNVKPNQTIKFTDIIRGEISFNSSDLDDQVLLKSDGFPTYHLAVVVDDYLMKISHVIRAEEWLPSTPKHVLLYQALGWEKPQFAHLPILRNPDRSKLSKRKNPVWAAWYLEQGFLPEAVLNYLGLLAYSHPENKEIFSLTEFTRILDLKRIQTTAPIFDINKLTWLNGETIRQLKPQELETKILNYLKQFTQIKLTDKEIKATVPLIQTRIKTLAEYWPLVKFIFEKPSTVEFSLSILKQQQSELIKLYEQIDWKHEIIYKSTEQFCQERALKPIKLFMELRYALSNQKVTAPLFESMEIIGKEQILKRLKQVLS